MNLIWRQIYINLLKKNYTETNQKPNSIQKLVITYVISHIPIVIVIVLHIVNLVYHITTI